MNKGFLHFLNESTMETIGAIRFLVIRLLLIPVAFGLICLPVLLAEGLPESLGLSLPVWVRFIIFCILAAIEISIFRAIKKYKSARKNEK